MFCREQAARFAAEHDAFRQLGAHLVAIGNGTAAMARDFVAQFGLDLPVYTDPGRGSFRAAGLKRNFGLGFRTIGRALRARRGGHRQGKVLGDPWQQGGVLAIGQDGRLLYRHVDSGAGDSAEPGTVLAELRAALAAS